MLDRKCERCGVGFKTWPRTVKRGGGLYCSRKCFGPGRCVDGRGYILIKMPNHARANIRGYVKEHLLVAEKINGGPLPKEAVVHHLNHKTDDNRPGNLMICRDQAEHIEMHRRDRIISLGGNPKKEKQCDMCRRLLPFKDFSKGAKACGLQGRCRECDHKLYLTRRKTEAVR